MKNLQDWKQFNESYSSDNEMLTEKALSELQKIYRSYFKDMLKAYGVKSPAKLSKEKKKEFFKNIRKYWVKGKGPSKTGEELIDAVNEK